MKSINRIFAIATLAILFCASIVAQPMKEPRQDNTPAYLISTAEEMAWFANEVNVNGNTTINAYLIEDITYNGDPIGTPENPYEGVFDGCFYNLDASVNCNGENSSGLFLYTGDGATIKNLNLYGTITGDGAYCSGLVGCLSYGTLKVSNVMLFNTLISGYTGSEKYLAGFVGETGGKGIVVIDNSAFVGSFVESGKANGELKICGFIGKDRVDDNDVHHNVSRSYFYPQSLTKMTDEALLYPYGDVYNYWDEDDEEIYAYAEASVVMFCNKLDIDVQETILPDVGPKNVSSKSESAFNTSSVIKSTGNNLSPNIWEAGTLYPILKVPSTQWIGGGNNGANAWNNRNNWSNELVPSHSVKAEIVPSENNPMILSSAKARSVDVVSGASLSISETGDLLTSALNIKDGGDVSLVGKSFLYAVDVNVAENGSFVMHYDYTNDSPSLIYLNQFNGKATIKRDFVANRLTYVGSAIEECTYESIPDNAWGYVYNYLGAQGWSMNEIFNDGLDDYTLFDNAPIETGRAIAVACANPGQQRYGLQMIQKGTPVSYNHSPFVVSTESANPNLVVVNNPYPYSVDISSTENITSAAWTIYVPTATAYKVASYNIHGGNNGEGTWVNTDSKGPDVAPFKTVTYTVPDGVSTITLSNVQAANNQSVLSKSAEINNGTLKVRLYVDLTSEEGEVPTPTDEVAFVFGDDGSMATDVKLLDTRSSQIEEKDPESGVVTYPNNQLFINKPMSSQDLAIACLPKQSEVVDYELPIRISIGDKGVTSLRLGSDVNAFDELYDVYLRDKLTGVFVNLREGDYDVPSVDVITDDRFAIVLTKLGHKPNVKEYIATGVDNISQDGSDLVITSKDGKVIVNNVPDDLLGSSIDVYNTLGVKVSSKQAEVNNTLDANGNGVRAVVVNNSQAKKILVK